ncbi:hypothetical protein NW762_010798 [Fusarium torreyae]|uniref:Glycosyl transferase CAP10 domain-containing protein n=1 Tax=Fusarium torreyae TaxID=1237075 RepID=A0A9W8RV14_9HYPO|nr:hypothetical protein NW762_010798 [Fusarium torreyae]
MASFVHRCFVLSSIGTCILCLLVPSFVFGSAGLLLSRAVEELTAAAEINFKFWEGQAATSQTLREATSEYKRRYGLLPPPKFDKWLEFALDNDSPIIDHFDQIYDDLLPFWGIEPATIRRRTGHLFDYSALEMGQLRIRNGTVEISPHIPGSHRWMMESMQRMIEPFARWLPDMDIAMNLADECRMAVPHEDMREIRDEAQRAMTKMMRPGQDIRTNATTNLTGSQWSSTFTEPLSGNVMSTYFSNNIRWQLYYDFVAPSCPPASLARKKRWWDWSTVCEECMQPHSILTSEGPLVADARLARDLCHQPDMAYLDGFIASPSMMVGTNTLFPIFSQGRVGGFSDIMIPSPWNFDKKSPYNESLDRSWDDKLNSLFWRGSSTDGYAAYGTWMGFSRARFVHEAYQKETKSSGHTKDSSINVSYAGSLSRCHEADCDMESYTFRTWAAGMHAAGQQESEEDDDSEELKELSYYVTPFEDNWKFRHLIDLDGAGFSGRFLPFLKSRSLVYRAALFQAWFDERLTAWHHYIPVDVRLGSGFWALFDFFSNKGGANSDPGDEHARKIAEQGRQWAQKALRPVDMQIYTFRLLLEWGRIIDDDREHLGLEE